MPSARRAVRGRAAIDRAAGEGAVQVGRRPLVVLTGGGAARRAPAAGERLCHGAGPGALGLAVLASPARDAPVELESRSVRRLFFALLFANLVYFGWALWVTPPPTVPPNETLARLPRLKLVDELPPEQRPEPSAR